MDEFFYKSDIVFLGGSLVSRGGQNPLEPVRYGCNIVHGKHVFNFTEIYRMLHKNKLAFEAKNFSKLKKIIFRLMVKEQNNKKKIRKRGTSQIAECSTHRELTFTVGKALLCFDTMESISFWRAFSYRYHNH